MGFVFVLKIKYISKAMFEVENYKEYVRIQSECAVRYLRCKFLYEKVNENDIYLRNLEHEVNKILMNELSQTLLILVLK